MCGWKKETLDQALVETTPGACNRWQKSHLPFTTSVEAKSLSG
jgi:hypothetical protein